MSAQTAAPRRRNQQAEPDDVVLARALEFTHWAKANIRIVITGAVIVLAVVAGLFWWRADRAAREERAAMEFMQLEQTVASGNTALAARELDSYIASFDGTDPAEEARLLLARIHLQSGDAEAAIAAVQGMAAGESIVETQGALLHAAALQAAGRTEDAIAAYVRVGESDALDYQRAEAFATAALLSGQGGDHAGAAELYARAADTVAEDSADRTLYEMRRAEAEALSRTDG